MCVCECASVCERKLYDAPVLRLDPWLRGDASMPRECVCFCGSAVGSKTKKDASEWRIDANSSGETRIRFGSGSSFGQRMVRLMD